jgi:site-specific DNA-methyltransferase (adenine-specific)
MLTTPAPRADVLEVISHLSNDEVFTPPKIANAVLDLLPDEVWSSPDLRWLDPATKSGVFMREITRRLLVGLEDVLPDPDERLDHVLRAMVFGVAITDLTSLMARRSLYCSKDATSARSTVAMEHPAGNVWFGRTEHVFAGTSCSECGAARAELGTASDKENHAYAFIHADGREAVEKEIGMKFDVVVGNPPYQLRDTGGKGSATPIYQHFIQMAQALEPDHLVMIAPSRWMAGGKGLDEFRTQMLGDRRLRRLVDFHDAAVLFPGINVNGGVCYFHWDRDHDGPCEFTSVYKSGRRRTRTRALDTYDILVRFNDALPILEKVRAKGEPTFDVRVSKHRPFGFRTFFKGNPGPPPPGALTLQARKPAWVHRDEVTINADLIDTWKVFVPRASDGNEIYPLPVLTEPIVAAPGTVCTETYLVLAPFDSEQHAEHCAAYVRTRFFRFLMSLRKMTQDNRRDRFSFIPDLDLDTRWTDELLYERYGITEGEQAYIAEIVRGAPE